MSGHQDVARLDLPDSSTTRSNHTFILTMLFIQDLEQALHCRPAINRYDGFMIIRHKQGLEHRESSNRNKSDMLISGTNA